jgi:hypothetical protein
LHDEVNALHEAGHAVLGDLLGRRIDLVTVEPGEHLTGCCWSTSRCETDPLPDMADPMILWAAGWQRRLAADVCVSMAGGLAEMLFTPRVTGRVPATVADELPDRLAELAEAAGPTEAELTLAAETMDKPGKTDANRIAEIAFTAHGGDLHRCAPWLAWLEAETTAVLQQHESAVRRLAGLLQLRGTVTGEAARMAMRPDRSS